MTTLTAARPPRHRLQRQPLHERLADWMDRPHPRMRAYVEDACFAVARWSLPVTIVVVAITTKGAGG